MYATRHSDPWIRLQYVVGVFLTLLWSSVTQQLLGVLGSSAPFIGPEVMSLAAVPQLTFLYRPLLHTTVIRQVGLPAPQGTDFEGPDPGLNPAIISAPEVCPNHYMRDVGGRCRPAFTYGPNPLSTFTPAKFKGSIQYYMSLQVGRPSHMGRRRLFGHFRNNNRRAGRLHLPLRTSTPPPPPTSTSTITPPPLDEERFDISEQPALVSVLPTLPSLTGPVAKITAIWESVQNNDPSSGDTQPIDDDDD